MFVFVGQAFPKGISSISVVGTRLFVGCVSSSVVVVDILTAPDLAFRVVAEDAIPRLLASVGPVDGESVCGGDKLGNLFLLAQPGRAGGSDRGAPFAWGTRGPTKVGAHTHTATGESQQGHGGMGGCHGSTGQAPRQQHQQSGAKACLYPRVARARTSPIEHINN